MKPRNATVRPSPRRACRRLARQKQTELAIVRGQPIIRPFHERFFVMKLMKLIPAFLLAAVTVTGADLNQPPKGFKALFNGKDLKGWWGLKTEDPAKWMALDKKALAKKKADSLKDIQHPDHMKDTSLVKD